MGQRLIDANALMERLERKKCEPAKVRYTEGYNDALMRFRSMVHGAPTVDAVPVVRCKDCKWAEVDAWWTYCKLRHKEDTTNSIIYTCTHDFYCADGERRTECIKP